MIPHIYVNASDDPGAYAADQCNVPRQAVTVAFAAEHLTDQALWLYNAEAETLGMDPWIILHGIDQSTSGNTYYLEYGVASSKIVQPDARVYVQRRDLKKLGLPEGQPGGRYKTCPIHRGMVAHAAAIIADANGSPERKAELIFAVLFQRGLLVQELAPPADFVI